MCSRRVLIWGLLVITFAVTCSSPRKLGDIRSGETAVSMSLPSDEEIAEENEEEIAAVAVDTSRNGEPIIMNAIRDDSTGEMVATDVIVASTVTARFRHVAERFGKILLEFDIAVPGEMMDSKWQLRFHPSLYMLGDSLDLDDVIVTGRDYRAGRLGPGLLLLFAAALPELSHLERRREREDLPAVDAVRLAQDGRRSQDRGELDGRRHHVFE